MIRFSCSHCGKQLSADESKAGKLGRCPACKETFKIPSPVEDDPPPTTVRPMRRPEPPVVRGDDEHDEPRRRRDESDDDDDSPREEERRPRRRRKKRRRSSGSGMPDWLTSGNTLMIALIAFGAIAVLSLALAAFVPVLALIPIGLGVLVALVGQVWFLIVAFQDDAMQGILCLLCGWYALYYLVANFAEEKWPFAVQIGGTLLAVAGMAVGGSFARGH